MSADHESHRLLTEYGFVAEPLTVSVVCAGVQASRCPGVQVCRCAGVQVAKCQGVQVSSCPGAHNSSYTEMGGRKTPFFNERSDVKTSSF